MTERNKHSLKKSLSNLGHSSSSVSPSSISDNEEFKFAMNRYRKKKQNREGISILDELRRSEQVNSRFFLSNQLQASVAFVVLVVCTYYVLAPKLAPWLSLGYFGTYTKITSFKARLSYVIQNSCFILLWIVGLELYKEYLRMLGDVNNITQHEVSLTDQIRLNNRIKLAEQLHFRSVSQFVLVIACQLSFAFDPHMSAVLSRLVPIFNYLYVLARLTDIFQPKRLKIFSFSIIYIPVFFCVLFNVKRQIYQSYQNSSAQ